MSRLTISFVAFSLLLLSGCRSGTSQAVNEVPLNKETKVTESGVNASEPALASDGKNAYLVYVEHSTKTSTDIYFQKLNSDGSADGIRSRVNPQAGQAKAWYGDPPTVQAGADGTIYVGWTAKDGEKGTTLKLSVSRDGGQSFESPVKVNDDAAPASHGMHSMAVRGESVYMAWLDERNVNHHQETAMGDHVMSPPPPDGYRFMRADHGPHPKPKNDEAKKTHEMGAEPNSEVFFAISSDGGKSFSPNKKLADEVCPCCKTSMTTAPDGKLYVSWRQVLDNGCRHVSVLSSADGGKTFSDPRIVSDDQWQINACPVSGAAMSADSAGSLKVAWYTAGDAGQPGIYSANSNDAGVSFGQRLLVSSSATGGTPLMISVGGNEYTIFAALGAIEIKPANGGGSIKINEAAHPSAASAGNNLFVSFVRGDAPNNSVHVAAFQIQ